MNTLVDTQSTSRSRVSRESTNLRSIDELANTSLGQLSTAVEKVLIDCRSRVSIENINKHLTAGAFSTYNPTVLSAVLSMAIWYITMLHIFLLDNARSPQVHF